MKFTPGQLRETIGLSVETFRHWKRVLPPFSGRKGHTPCFSHGDLLVAAILRRLTEQCHIRVGSLSRVSVELVELCNSMSWAALERMVLLVEPKSANCQIVSSLRNADTSEIAITCSLKRIIEELRNTLLRSQTTTGQQQLYFPPVDVERKHVSGRRAK